MRRPFIDSPGLVGAVTRFWQRSYAADYVGFALLEAAFMGVEFFVEPFHRMFSLDDMSKQYPHAEIQRVSASQMVIYAGVVPLCVLIVWLLVFRAGLHKGHVTVLGFLISVTLTLFLTDVIKNAVGRPRPDLIARCKPKQGTAEHVLVTIDVCTETDHHTLHDGWRSFPSGHSSFAFAGLGYLAIFLAGQLHIFRPRTDLARVLIALTPLLCAALIAMSRLADYRHDVFDVTCGSILGISVAFFSYRRYYRHLMHSKCDEPYPSHADYAAARGLGKARDEEQQLRNVESFELDDLTEEEEEARPLNDTRLDRAKKQRDHG